MIDVGILILTHLAIAAGYPPFPWALLPFGVLLCIGLALTLAWYFWPVSFRRTHIGGGLFFPRVELRAEEHLDAKYRASLVRNDRGKETEGGWFVITSLRAIFMPSRFPWERKTPMIIEFDAVTHLERGRIPAPSELGVLGNVLRVRGLRVDTMQGSVWLGKPNTDKIERALRSHTGL
jgi:hypothetical protein